MKPQPAPQGLRILNVDDDEIARYVKTRILRQGGHQVSEAGSGGEALAAIAAGAPDLAVLDVKLPDMQLLLEKMGHEVRVVTDGRDALDVAFSLKPDVILLDIGLPGMDGYELAQRLRAAPETRAANIIAVSGYGQEKDRTRSLDMGFDLHLVKPVDPARLTEAIRTVRH